MAWVQFLNTTLVLERRMNLYGVKAIALISPVGEPQ